MTLEAAIATARMQGACDYRSGLYRIPSVAVAHLYPGMSLDDRDALIGAYCAGRCNAAWDAR